MFKPKKSQLVGVDLGSYSVKVAELETGKNGLRLKNFGMGILPPDSISEGVIKDPGSISHVLAKVFDNLKIKNKNIVTAISGASVILKTFTVTSKSLKEIQGEIQSEAEQHIPYDLNEVYLDYDFPLIDRETLKPEQKLDSLDIVLVAANKAIVNSYVELFEKADLNPIIMDVAILAIQNAIEAIVPELPETYGIASIGASTTSINIVQKGIPIFTRDSPIGGEQLTKALMANLSLDYLEAEELKLGGRPIPEKKEKTVRELFKQYVSEWTEEVGKAIEYFRATHPEIPVSKLYMVGGTSKLPGLKDTISYETGILVEIVNPFQGLLIDTKEFDEKYLSYYGPEAVEVIGLALRMAGDK